MTIEEKIEKLRKSQRLVIRALSYLMRNTGRNIYNTPHAIPRTESAAAKELDESYDSLSEELFL